MHFWGRHHKDYSILMFILESPVLCLLPAGRDYFNIATRLSPGVKEPATLNPTVPFKWIEGFWGSYFDLGQGRFLSIQEGL